MVDEVVQPLEAQVNEEWPCEAEEAQRGTASGARVPPHACRPRTERLQLQPEGLGPVVACLRLWLCVVVGERVCAPVAGDMPASGAGGGGGESAFADGARGACAQARNTHHCAARSSRFLLRQYLYVWYAE